MATTANIFVGSISWGATEEMLEQAFAQFGTVVSCKIMTDRETGRSRGFGFVEMSTPEEAQAAIDGMHGQQLDGRPLVVNEARPKPDRGSFGGGN